MSSLWLAPVLYQDGDHAGAALRREAAVAPAQRYQAALRKRKTTRTSDAMPVHSYSSLLKKLASLTRNTIQPQVNGLPSFEKTSLPTPFQRRVFDLLGVLPP